MAGRWKSSISIEQLDDYIATAVQVSGDLPVLIDQYLRDAVECDVDALCDGEQVVVAGVMQHIEEAGIHSGDSACTLPPYSLSDDIVAEMERQAEALAMALGVKGLMNIQFAVKEGPDGQEVYLIEVNPRASRTVPFVAKAIGQPVAKIASRVMAGEKLSTFPPFKRALPYMAVKEAVFPFARFPGVDPVLSPEMKSTGEVMGIDGDFSHAFLKAQLGAGMTLPQGGTAFVSVKNADKAQILDAVRQLVAEGFRVIATGGTQKYLADAGLPVERVNKVAEGRPPRGRQDRRWRCGADLQHHRRLAEPQGSAIDPRLGADQQGPVLHDRGRQPRRCTGNFRFAQQPA
ncbi:hypothetical protein ACFSTD_08495 [Novosphingobium colocasiae]